MFCNGLAGFPLVFQWFGMVLSLFCNGFAMVLPSFCKGLAMVWRHGFAMVLPWFEILCQGFAMVLSLKSLESQGTAIDQITTNALKSLKARRER